MTTDATDDTQHSVYDGDRELQFVGRLLGMASSEAPGKARWAELRLYRTRSNRYILAGTGRTRVPGESERRWAHVSETPQGIIESLYMYDNDNVKYLTRLARNVLDQAMLHDQDLARAFRVEVID